MDSIFIPTVVDIKPVGKEVSTTDEQGKNQSAILKVSVNGTMKNGKSEESELEKIGKDLPLIDKTKKPSLVIPGKTYTEDTKVTEKTVLTYENGETETFAPVESIPSNTSITTDQPFKITGTGNVRVSGVLINKGTVGNAMRVPAGSVLEGTAPTTSAPVTVLRNGVEVTVAAGSRLQTGDQLVTPLEIVDENQVTTWTVTLQKGDVIPPTTANSRPILLDSTKVNQLIETKGDSITVDGIKYINYKDTIPKGTKTSGNVADLMNLPLPDATHVNPDTGEVTRQPRRYTFIRAEEEIVDGKVLPAEIVIENEGTYTQT